MKKASDASEGMLLEAAVTEHARPTDAAESSTNVRSLPSEILFMILCYSLEPNLMHVCRHLKERLPPFVQWTKSLSRIAICLSESTAYLWYEEKIQQYYDSCGIRPLTSSWKREIRSAVFSSSWFGPRQFRATLRDLSAAMRRRVHEYQVTGRHRGVRPFGTFQNHVHIRGGSICVFSVDEWRIAKTTYDWYPGSWISIWSADSGIKSTAVRGTAVTKAEESGIGYELTGEMGVLRFIWGLNDRPQSSLAVGALKDALVACILQNNILYLTQLLDRLSWAHETKSLGGVEWKYVQLAAELGFPQALKLLLHRPIWPAWDGMSLRQLADDVKKRKTGQWAEVYRLLCYEWRMEQVRDQYHVQKTLMVSDAR